MAQYPFVQLNYISRHGIPILQQSSVDLSPLIVFCTQKVYFSSLLFNQLRHVNSWVGCGILVIGQRLVSRLVLGLYEPIKHK